MSSSGRVGLEEEPGQILELTEEECWGHLRCGDLGRLAIVVDGRPEIFPMNYGVSGDAVVFRTAPGAKLTHGRASIAAFEIDGYSAETGTGWSVVAQGRMEEITDRTDDDSRALRALSVHPYAAGAKEHKLVLRAARVTGRRFTWGPLAPRPTFPQPLD